MRGVSIPSVIREAANCGTQACLLAFLGGCLVAAAAATLHGTVMDSEGAAIPLAHIIVHEDGSGRMSGQRAADVVLSPDERGRFNIQLAPGFYDVCVLAQAFTPQCLKVLAKSSQTIDMKVRLKVDPQVVKQLGDKF